MRTFENARYRNAEHTEVSVTIDGVRSTVPAVPGNPDWDDMVRAEIPIAPFENA
jgi:hypothetical protein